MDEETPTKDARVIRLSQDDYEKLERAMQWPEDLAKYDRLNTPTNLADLMGQFTKL